MAKEKIHHYSSYNLGISILKMMMCFLVIVSHIWGVNVTYTGPLGWIYYLRNYPVTVFMILSFFFMEKTLTNLDGKKILTRIIRLVVPLFGWALVYWGFYKLLQEFLYPGYDLRIKDLFWQMFTGNSIYLNGTMWFQVNLIALTVLFAIVIFIARKYKNGVFAILGVLCLVVQYGGYSLFIYGWKSELIGCVGRLPEMLPCAVIGYLLSDTGALEKTRKHWIFTAVFAVIGIRLLRYYEIFADVKGFDYAGLEHIFVALMLILLFYAPPLEKLPKWFHVAVEWITKYTFGIYCMHRLVATLLHYFISHRSVNLETFNFPDCIHIYLISYLICFLISKIPCKWIKMMVE